MVDIGEPGMGRRISGIDGDGLLEGPTRPISSTLCRPSRYRDTVVREITPSASGLSAPSCAMSSSVKPSAK
jgi:hypothetical protein